MKTFEFKAQDGKVITTYLWAETPARPKGVVQVMHGMSEHMGRYQELAEKLNAAGFVVVGDDHRVHGATAGGEDNIGIVSKADGDVFYKTLKDEFMLTDSLLKTYGDLPFFVLGHSYGSFLAQKYLTVNYKKVDGAILTGSACMKGSWQARFGKLVCKFNSPTKRATLLHKMSFDKYDKSFDSGRWITRDENISNAYYADPACTKVFSYGFYKSFFGNLLSMYKRDEWSKIRKNLPILLLSGDKDPVGGQGKLVEKLRDMYLKYGLTDVTMKLYADARHEVFNETNREEVYADVIAFLNRAIETREEDRKAEEIEREKRKEYFDKALVDAKRHLDAEAKAEETEKSEDDGKHKKHKKED